MNTRQAPFRFTWLIYPQYSRQKSKDVNCWVILFSRTFTIIHSLLNHYKWNDPVTNYLRFCQLMRKTQRIYSCCIHATLISIVLHDLYFVFCILHLCILYFVYVRAAPVPVMELTKRRRHALFVTKTLHHLIIQNTSSAIISALKTLSPTKKTHSGPHSEAFVRISCELEVAWSIIQSTRLTSFTWVTCS